MLNQAFRMTNAWTLTNRLCYKNLEIPWLAKEKIIENIRENYSGYKKAGKRLDEKLAKRRENSSLEIIYDWWRNAVEIPEREIYIFIPLGSINADYSTEYTNIPSKNYADPLDITKKSNYILKDMLEELDMEDKTYLVYLDDLFFPFPVMPEKFNTKQNLDSVPDNLRNYFKEHECLSSVRDLGESMERIRTLHKYLKEEAEKRKFPLSGYMKEFEENEKEFEKNLRADITILKTFTGLQMKKFIESQLKKKFVYILGYKNEAGQYFSEEELEKFNWINPLEGVSGNQQVRIVKEGGYTSSSSIKRLKSRIENTYLNRKKGEEKKWF